GGPVAAEGSVRRLSAREIAALTNGQLAGAPDVSVTGVAPLDRAGPDDLSFLASKRYLPYFQRSSAAIVLCKPDLVEPGSAGPGGRDLWRAPRLPPPAHIP